MIRKTQPFAVLIQGRHTVHHITKSVRFIAMTQVFFMYLKINEEMKLNYPGELK